MIQRIIIGIGTWMFDMEPYARAALVVFYAFLFGLFLFRKITEASFRRSLDVLFATVVGWFAFEMIAVSAAQYSLWQQSTVSEYLLPPYQPAGYFLRYVWFHFVQGTALAWGMGIVFFLLFALGTALSRGRFFFGDECASGAISIILNPWPSTLLVLPTVLVLGLGAWLVRIAGAKVGRRPATEELLSLRLLWPVAGIVVFLVGNLIGRLLGLGALKT